MRVKKEGRRSKTSFNSVGESRTANIMTWADAGDEQEKGHNVVTTLPVTGKLKILFS